MAERPQTFRYRVRTDQGDYILNLDRELTPAEQTPEAMRGLLRQGLISGLKPEASAPPPGSMPSQAPAAPPQAPQPQVAEGGSSLARLPNLFARGGMEAATGLVDLPLNVVQALAQIIPALGGPQVNIPGAGGARQLLEAYGAATGGMPQAQGPVEAIVRALGEQLTGAAMTFGAGGAMPAGSLAQRALSSGNLGADMTLATGAGVGQGAAEAMAPGSGAASMAGALTGGLAPALPRAAARTGLSALGVRQPNARVGETTGLTPSQLETRQSYQDAGIRHAASDITGNRGVAAVELLPTRFPIGSGPTQRFAEGQMGDVRRSVNQTFAPLGRDAQPLESGLQAQRDVSGKVIGQREAAGKQAESFIERLGPRVSRLQAVEALRRDVGETMQVFQQAKRVAFDATEQITGDAPVVRLRNLHGVTEPMTAEAAQTGMGTPRGTGALDRLGRPQVSAEAAELRQVLTPQYLASLQPAQRQQMEQFLSSMTTDQPIPFWMARRIESQLGEIAFGRAQPVGTMTQGKAANLYAGIRRDIDQFLESTPEGQVIDPLLRRAKEDYRRTKTVMNETIVSKLAGRRGSAEPVIETIFGGGKNLEPVLDLKATLSDEAWQTLVASGFAQGFEQAMSRAPNGVRTFTPQAFVKWGDRLQSSGKLDLLLTPEQQGHFEVMMREMSALGGSKVARVDDLVKGKDPSRAVANVFKPGVVERTRDFKAVADPETFDDAVRAWATELRESVKIPKSRTSTGQEMIAPTVLARKLEPYIQSGQLDVMLERFPGMAERLKQAVPVLTGMGKRETLAGNPSGTAQALLAAGQIGTIANSVEDVLAAIATQRPGGVVQGLKLGVVATGLPYAIGRMTTSPTGIRVLSEGIKDKYSPAAIRLMERILGVGLDREASRPGESPATSRARGIFPTNEQERSFGLAGVRG